MKRSMGYFVVILLIAIVGTALALFLNQNADPVVLYFGAEWLGYFKTRELSLGNLVLISFLLGIFISGFSLAANVFTKSMELRRLRRELEAIQRTLELKTRK